MTGAMMQGVTRNPIAEPSLLGISQGATLFVALLYASGISATAGNTLLAALLGAFFSGVPVLIFTMKNPGNLSITKLLLAGTAMSTFFTALTSVAGLLSNQSPMKTYWILGIRRISRGNVAGCKNYFSGRDTGISGSSAPCTEN